MSATNRAERAKEHYFSGLNCAQSTTMALADEVGLDESVIKAVAAPFGGGVARSRSLCGAVSGMLMAIGAAHPDYTKAEIYAISRKAMEEFSSRFGSLNCSELLSGLNVDNSPAPSERTAEYYASRPCGDIIAGAVEIAEKFIKKESKP